jgi:GNAT superfamily N-acetyltransferase
MDWLDVHLKGDYYFRRGHLAGILSRSINTVSWVVVDGEPAGVVIVYQQTTLHNLYLAPAFRKSGIGQALMDHFQPQVIRAKTNMVAGDPVPFYQKAGFEVTSCDPNRPWIVLMERNGMNVQQANGQPTPQHQQQPGPAAQQPALVAPKSMTISGPLLQQFLKFVKWQSASKKKQEEKRQIAKMMAATRAAQHFEGPPGWYFDGRQWQQGQPPPAAAQPAEAQPVPGTLASFDDVMALYGDGDGGRA